MDTKAGTEKTAGRHLLLIILMVLLVGGLSRQPSSAETFLCEDQHTGKGRCSLRYMRPGFSGERDVSTLSGIYDLGVSVSARPDLFVVSSIPYIVANYSRGSERSGIGNVYLGIRHCRGENHRTNSMESIGLFLPTVGTNTLNWFGYLTNFQQQHKYLSKTLTLSGTYAHRRSWPNGGLFGFQIGPDLWIPTERGQRDGEILLHYGLDGGFRANHLTVMLEVVGLALITEDWDDLGDLVKHAVVVGVQRTGGRFRPGMFLQFYLEDDLRDSVDGVLGFRLEFVPD